MIPAHGRFAENSLFLRCHVTMNQPMNARVVCIEKKSSYITVVVVIIGAVLVVLVV